MTGVGDDSRARSASKPWLAVGFLLALGATVALVLTDDLRWIRLAVVAALWAALIGALMAAQYRRQAATSEKSASKAQQIYELELQKEISARREHELEIESETRRRVESESRDELEALREEMRTLRENLQNLFGGEVLWERVALTAQSTRMRKLGEEPKLVAAGEPGNGRPAQLTVGADAEVVDQPTELIGRVRDRDAEPAPEPAEPDEPMVARAEQPRRREPGPPRTRFVPRPSRPAEDSRPNQQPVDPPTRRVQPKPGAAMARASEAANRARSERSRSNQRPVAGPPGTPPPAQYAPRRAPEPAAERPVERSRPAVAPVDAAAAGGSAPSGPAAVRRPQPAVEEAPTRTQSPVEGRTAVTPPIPPRRGGPPARPVPPRTADAQPPTEVRAPVTRRPPPAQAPKPAQQAQPQPAEPSAASAGSTGAVGSTGATESTGSGSEATVAGAPVVSRAQPAEPAAPEPNPTLPPEIRDARPSGGRRRRAEPADKPASRANGSTTAPETTPQSGRGRRYRADDEQPSWLGTSSEGDAEPGAGRRRAPEPEFDDAEPAGSHAEGRSVSDLLAAYGASGASPRRRRRAAD
ncbi:hypothetical protein B1813_11915 [Saccharomonospora piscinae]|uniref:DUF6779 domain-containing protein n=1 Tax=Saccharomonospora piscinae TaxID=687388 RepID=A0A1V9A6S9_SACPI|nr:DUF6779 domain-containing protein [Saccharomonospora piscinae]OQO92837.1 hypothetical protein B1813_11915 [Saccharomonospora piscinae]